jgi:hypothetical protein
MIVNGLEMDKNINQNNGVHKKRLPDNHC